MYFDIILFFKILRQKYISIILIFITFFLTTYFYKYQKSLIIESKITIKTPSHNQLIFLIKKFEDYENVNLSNLLSREIDLLMKLNYEQIKTSNKKSYLEFNGSNIKNIIIKELINKKKNKENLRNYVEEKKNQITKLLQSSTIKFFNDYPYLDFNDKIYKNIQKDNFKNLYDVKIRLLEKELKIFLIILFSFLLSLFTISFYIIIKFSKKLFHN